MALEEQLRSQPLDAVVLVGGCDKTVPAHLMAAASAGVPAVQVVSGPMLAGEWRGRRTGACTDCRAYWAEHRAGVLGADDIASVEGALCPTAGTCMVMGTASTMAILAEALGMSTPGSADRTRADRRAAGARRAGRPARGTAGPRAAATRPTCSTAVPSTTRSSCSPRSAGPPTRSCTCWPSPAAPACRSRSTTSARSRATSRSLVDVKPSGSGYLEDLHRAGGVPALLRVLRPLLEPGARTVAGPTLGEIADAAADARRLAAHDPLASTTRSRRPAGSPSCAAAWRPTAR